LTEDFSLSSVVAGLFYLTLHCRDPRNNVYYLGHVKFFHDHNDDDKEKGKKDVSNKKKLLMDSNHVILII